jgi:hypothetical protein
MTAATATLDSLRTRHEELTLRAETAELERHVRGLELSNRLVESQWGDTVDRREYLFDTPDWNRGYCSRLAQPGDRARGKDYPFFETEQDLQAIVGGARWLAAMTPIGIAALSALATFTLGTGFQYEADPRQETGDAKNPLVAEVNRAIEEILEINQWTGDKEEECFRRAHRDGECFRWAKDEGGYPLIEVPEPCYVTEPAQVRELEDYLGTGGYDWSFGVATQPGRHDRPFGYFLKWEGRDWDMAPAAEVSHVKLNVDRQVKRGLSDFMPTQEVIDQTIKLTRNVMQGSAVQASIAYIKEHVAGTTSDSITTARNTRATHTRQETTQAGNVRTIYGEKFAPGRVLETAGTKYHAGPLGQPSHPLYIAVIQAGFRQAAIRWEMPEYMISADASNNNFASILVAGSPFVRATERRQEMHKRANEDLLWKCLAVYVRRGRFTQYGVGTLTELKREVQIKVDAPSAAIANRIEEEGIRDKQQAAGILSKKTRSAQSNLDYEVEQANIAEEPKNQSAQIGLQAPPQPQAQSVMLPTQAAIEAETALRLNGAQITAAVSVLDGVANGTTAELSAIELLSAVGIDEPTARRMVAATKANAKPKPQATVAAALESVRTTEEAKAILETLYP